MSSQSEPDRRPHVHEWRQSSRGMWHAFVGRTSTHSQCMWLSRDPTETRRARSSGIVRVGSRKTPPPAGSRICSLCAADIGYEQRGPHKRLGVLRTLVDDYDSLSRSLIAELEAIIHYAPELLSAATEATDNYVCSFEAAGSPACDTDSPGASCQACLSADRLRSAVLAFSAETAQAQLAPDVGPARPSPADSEPALCGARYPGRDWPGRVLCERSAALDHEIHVNDSYSVTWGADLAETELAD